MLVSDGEMCTSSVTCSSGEAAERALWRLVADDQVHVEHDRRFRRESNWSQALADMGLTGLHFHDLRHTGTRSPHRAGRARRTSRRGWDMTATGQRADLPARDP